MIRNIPNSFERSESYGLIHYHQRNGDLCVLMSVVNGLCNFSNQDIEFSYIVDEAFAVMYEADAPYNMRYLQQVIDHQI